MGQYVVLMYNKDFVPVMSYTRHLQRYSASSPTRIEQGITTELHIATFS